MTKNAQNLKRTVLSLTGRGLKDKINKVMNRLDLSDSEPQKTFVASVINTHI